MPKRRNVCGTRLKADTLSEQQQHARQLVSEFNTGEIAMADNRPSPAEAVRATVPKLIDLTEKVLFGDVWERPELSKRDRSLITCAALVAMQRPDQLRFHLARALQNGVTQAELSELITHLAFYSGWPTAMTAANLAKEVFEKRGG
jgi:4-carboxymuconolactone decarboxylase